MKLCIIASLIAANAAAHTYTKAGEWKPYAPGFVEI